jgi:hypothetical protein
MFPIALVKVYKSNEVVALLDGSCFGGFKNGRGCVAVSGL